MTELIKAMNDLLELSDDKKCDYKKCLELIEEMGGCTQIVEGQFGLQTTPLHEVIDNGHYTFALELIETCKADLNVQLDDREAISFVKLFYGNDSRIYRDYEVEALKQKERISQLLSNK